MHATIFVTGQVNEIKKKKKEMSVEIKLNVI